MSSEHSKSSNRKCFGNFDRGAPSDCTFYNEALDRRRKEAEKLQSEVNKQRRKAQQEAERVTRLEAERLRRQTNVEQRAQKKNMLERN